MAFMCHSTPGRQVRTVALVGRQSDSFIFCAHQIKITCHLNALKYVYSIYDASLLLAGR